MKDKINICLIASGSGTDANAIMAAWRAGQIPHGDIRLLISTKREAGCLEKAKKHDVKAITIAKKELGEKFDDAIWQALQEHRIELIFLVGCIHKIDNRGIPMYNIHPANPREHGGKGMYGLVVHEHVLAQIRDQIARGWSSPDGRYYTYPTVHECIPEYDQGKALLQGTVEVYPETDTPEKLQQRVLPYEWIMLPAAVNMAIQRILSPCK